MIDRQVQNELKEKYNPEGSKLRTLQLQILDILIEIDRICIENNISYWLSSGTLLGAVRHEGFIPWDDDIDIEMFPEDYKKFVEVVMNKGFSKKSYVLQNHDTDNNYFEAHAKVRNEDIQISDIYGIDRDYKYKGIFVDIFIVKRANKTVIKLFQPVGKVFDKLKIFKFLHGGLRSIILKSYYAFFYKFIIPIVYKFIDKEDDIYFPSIGSRWNANGRIKSEIIPLKKYLFEGRCFLGPQNSDLYLNTMFGNYMELPKSIRTHTKL